MKYDTSLLVVVLVLEYLHYESPTQKDQYTRKSYNLSSDHSTNGWVWRVRRRSSTIVRHSGDDHGSTSIARSSSSNYPRIWSRAGECSSCLGTSSSEEARWNSRRGGRINLRGRILRNRKRTTSSCSFCWTRCSNARRVLLDSLCSRGANRAGGGILRYWNRRCWFSRNHSGILPSRNGRRRCNMEDGGVLTNCEGRCGRSKYYNMNKKWKINQWE